MRILVSADVEGATGLTGTDDVIPGTEQWQRFRRLFTGDVNAVVAGLLDGGRITAETTQTEQGHHGHFADPDGFLWKITHQPVTSVHSHSTGPE